MWLVAMIRRLDRVLTREMIGVGERLKTASDRTVDRILNEREKWQTEAFCSTLARIWQQRLLSSSAVNKALYVNVLH